MYVTEALAYRNRHLLTLFPTKTAVSVFYIFYVLAEFPASMLVKRLQFNRVIPTITFCWGVVCLCTGFVHSFGPLIVTRILLGFFEGCLFPSMTLFLCNWYKREELGFRVAFLFSKYTWELRRRRWIAADTLQVAAAISGAFGGLLAWAMLHMDGVSGLAGWRWCVLLFTLPHSFLDISRELCKNLTNTVR